MFFTEGRSCGILYGKEKNVKNHRVFFGLLCVQQLSSFSLSWSPQTAPTRNKVSNSLKSPELTKDMWLYLPEP